MEARGTTKMSDWVRQSPAAGFEVGLYVVSSLLLRGHVEENGRQSTYPAPNPRLRPQHREARHFQQ
jgi:hypothetical protein